MKRPLVASLLFLTACYGSQESGCQTGSGPTPTTATPTPTPSPSPSPSVTPNPCSFTTLAIGFDDDSQHITSGTRKLLYAVTLDKDGNKLVPSCNNGRSPSWSQTDSDFCEVIGSGFNPNLLARSVTIDKCRITATLRDQFTGANHASDVFAPEIR